MKKALLLFFAIFVLIGVALNLFNEQIREITSPNIPGSLPMPESVAETYNEFLNDSRGLHAAIKTCSRPFGAYYSVTLSSPFGGFGYSFDQNGKKIGETNWDDIAKFENIWTYRLKVLTRLYTGRLSEFSCATLQQGPSPFMRY